MDDQNKLTQTTRPVTKFGIFCWALFNWAHNAFPTVIITFVFSTYFTREIAHNTIRGTADWGWGIGYFGGLVCLVIALTVFIEPTWLGSTHGLSVRVTTLFVATWFIVFF